MGTKTTGTSSTVPWSAQQPGLLDIYGRGAGLSQDPFAFYPESTVAARQPAEALASERLQARGLQGSPAVKAGQEAIRGTAAGEFLSPDTNPYLRATYGAAAEEVTRSYYRTVLPGMETRFGGAGRGAMVRDPQGGNLRAASGAFGAAEARSQDELAQNLNELGARIFGGAYEAERGRQIQAAAMAPGLAAEDYRDLSALQGAGVGDRQYAQSVLEDAMARFEFGQEEPWMRAERYKNLLVEGPSFTTTKTKGKETDIMGIVGAAVQGVGSIASLVAMCSRTYKNLEGEEKNDLALEKLLAVAVYRWSYKGLEEDLHVGPMAEDWQAATGLGDGKTINLIDYCGTLHAAVRALASKVAELETKLAAKEA